MTMGNVRFETHKETKMTNVWHGSVDSEGADVDDGTQKNTDDLNPHVTGQIYLKLLEQV